MARDPQDMAEPEPMNRLLQGDVGSGKTVVAAGRDAASPSRTATRRRSWRPPRSWPSSTTCTLDAARWRSSAVTRGAAHRRAPRGKAREKVLARRLGRARSASSVGTHALIQEDVEFQRLGLVVIDEQHRFGVHAARRAAGARASRPDVLVMTATPDPAHARADALRRPRRLGDRRAAARAHADRAPGSRRGGAARWSLPFMRERAGSAGARPTSSTRWSRSRRSSTSRAATRDGRAAAHGGLPESRGRRCCTGGCRPTRRTR